jgi:hypothetical protein
LQRGEDEYCKEFAGIQIKLEKSVTDAANSFDG